MHRPSTGAGGAQFMVASPKSARVADQRAYRSTAVVVSLIVAAVWLMIWALR